MAVSGTGSGFSYRILVVDDEENIRTTSSAILAQHGYEVITAVDGFAGLVELRRSLPDVVISDLRMPDMSGFEFLSVVRRRFPHIAVIAVSGEYNGSEPTGLSLMLSSPRGSTRPSSYSGKSLTCWRNHRFVPILPSPTELLFGCPRMTLGTSSSHVPNACGRFLFRLMAFLLNLKKRNARFALQRFAIYPK